MRMTPLYHTMHHVYQLPFSRLISRPITNEMSSQFKPISLTLCSPFSLGGAAGAEARAFFICRYRSYRGLISSFSPLVCYKVWFHGVKLREYNNWPFLTLIVNLSNSSARVYLKAILFKQDDNIMDLNSLVKFFSVVFQLNPTVLGKWVGSSRLKDGTLWAIFSL